MVGVGFGYGGGRWVGDVDGGGVLMDGSLVRFPGCAGMDRGGTKKFKMGRLGGLGLAVGLARSVSHCRSHT